MSLEKFQAWSGAVDTLDRIIEEDKCTKLENILEDLYPDGLTDTELNDILWFDSEQVYEWLGIRSETMIREELENLNAELEDLNAELENVYAEYYDDCIGIADWERQEIWEEEYAVTAEELKEQIAELNEQIIELEEELENI
jgi:hypothetical protein